MPHSLSHRFHRTIIVLPALVMLPACATIGSMMSPYSEKFSCKNDDHGQCIHPEQAYEDAVAGNRSKSDPRVTNDKAMLRRRLSPAAWEYVRVAGLKVWTTFSKVTRLRREIQLIAVKS